MPTTSLGAPYPDLAGAPNVPADIQALAVWVDAYLVALATGKNMGTPASTAATGTSTSAATETRDAVLGDYTFTAVAGRRYRVILDGLILSTSVAADVVVVRIRNGGSSTPTAASTLVASAQTPVAVAGGPGSLSLPVADTFVPGAGVQTLSVFCVRLSGTGVETPLGLRELFVVDVGPA